LTRWIYYNIIKARDIQIDRKAVGKVVDKEMLEAVRAVMKEELEPVNARLERIEQRQASMQEDMDVLKKDVSVLKEDMDVLKEDSAINRLASNILLEWADVFDRTTLNEIIKNHVQG
jgi:predicted nuclease with TOPRIM domain